jgi:glutamine synthetase
MQALKDSLDELIVSSRAQFIDLRFTDLLGKEHHISLPIDALSYELINNGKMFDGSSIPGWQSIHESDLSLKPDLSTAIVDPFYEVPTVSLHCDVFHPSRNERYLKDPRAVAYKAQQYLLKSDIADTAYFGPEPEFFIFDDARWETNMHHSSFTIDSNEGIWNSNKQEQKNLAHRPTVKGGYFPLSPIDSHQNIRTEMCVTLQNIGQTIEAHHHEVATAQNEIATKFDQLLKKADEVQVCKYVVRNVAFKHGKTATFMPKPLVYDNGNGMHCHQSLYKDGINLFAGDQYAELSEMALFYIGGIIKHAKSLNAFTNPGTNSYKRLVPGFEAPVLLAYSARNRSAAIRIPHVDSIKAKRIEVRFPDPLANPYLAFSAMLMAGLDGIKNKIHPGTAMDKDLFELPQHELNEIPTVSSSLEESLSALENDMDYLLAGDVFSNELIESYITLKRNDISRLKVATHPLEFDMYYSA